LREKFPQGFFTTKGKRNFNALLPVDKNPLRENFPQGVFFFSLFFPNPIIARWASQGCQGSPLASLAPMNGRLRLPPLTAFAHLAYISNKERKGKRNQHSNHHSKNQNPIPVTSGTIVVFLYYPVPVTQKLPQILIYDLKRS